MIQAVVLDALHPAAAGNPTRLVDALGYATTIAYDAFDRRTSVQTPSGGITTTAYDAAGNQTAVTDPLNHTTTFSYDAGNRLTKTTDAEGGVTSLYPSGQRRP